VEVVPQDFGSLLVEDLVLDKHVNILPRHLNFATQEKYYLEETRARRLAYPSWPMSVEALARPRVAQLMLWSTGVTCAADDDDMPATQNSVLMGKGDRKDPALRSHLGNNE